MASPGVFALRSRPSAGVVSHGGAGGLQLLQAAGQASSRIVTGPSLTSSTCMCAPNTPVSTGTPSARSAST